MAQDILQRDLLLCIVAKFLISSLHFQQSSSSRDLNHSHFMTFGSMKRIHRIIVFRREDCCLFPKIFQLTMQRVTSNTVCAVCQSIIQNCTSKRVILLIITILFHTGSYVWCPEADRGNRMCGTAVFTLAGNLTLKAKVSRAEKL